MNNTTVKSKGHQVIRYEGGTRITSTLCWIGNIGQPRTQEQECLISKIVSIRRAIRKTAENKLIENIASNLMEKGRQRIYQLKTERSRELQVPPKYIKTDTLLKRKGIMVLEM